MSRKDYVQAASTGLEILRKQPNNVKAEFLTALAFQHNNQTDKARQHYLHIIQSHPNLPEPRNNLALIYLQQGQHEEAIDLLISSMQTNPAYATIWSNLKSIYQGLASEAYRKALNSESGSSNAMEGIELAELTTLSEPPAATQTSSTNMEETHETIDPASVPALTLAPALVPAPSLSSPAASYPLPGVSLEDQLTKTLQDWASAWSTQNIEQYILAYTEDYKGNSSSHADWVEQRRSRILKPGEIKVELNVTAQCKIKG
ncbi:MAG: tetratricopeptide repeat protein [Gammaproteobacteria bacterium]|nr:tetratricopeptide repeat protein [Gammaproteobacteria bacterium]